jgi:PBP1b-binding outer membrane lipoprotein LpoB
VDWVYKKLVLLLLVISLFALSGCMQSTPPAPTYTVAPVQTVPSMTVAPDVSTSPAVSVAPTVTLGPTAKSTSGA